MNMITTIKKLKNLSILWKLIIAYTVIIAIPILLFSSIIIDMFTQKTINDYSNLLKTQLVQLENNINKELNNAKTTANFISSNRIIIDYLNHYGRIKESYDYQLINNLRNFMDYVSQKDSVIQSIYIFTLNNEVQRYQRIILPWKYIQDDENLSEIQALKYKETHWSGIHPDRFFEGLDVPSSLVRNEPVFSLYQKIYDKELKNTLAYLELNLRAFDLFNTLIPQSNDLNLASLFITDDSGQIIYHSKNAPELYDSSTLSSSGDSEPNGSLTVNNQKYLCNNVYIEDLKSRIFLLYPFDPIASATRNYNLNTLILLLASLTGILLITYLISILIFKRLRKLVNQMKQVQQGHFDIEVKVSQNDEIGIIERAFATMLSEINRLINAVYKTKLAEKEATLSYLQAQINPHFLFNALETIRMIAEVNNNETVSEGLFSLSKVLKTHIKPKSFSTLQQELDVVSSYVYVQNLRMNNKFHLDIQLEEGLEGTQVPNLSLQPLVENAILHGLKTKPEDCVIRIRAYTCKENEGDMEISVWDNGKGFPEDALVEIQQRVREDFLSEDENDRHQGNGVALKNIHERIHLYYGEAYGLTIQSVYLKETCTTIRLPKNK
jgi:two-component system sensor histidine kinase YesM